MKSKIFYTQIYKRIENRIKDFFNKYPDFLGKDTAVSTRATGDAIQHILEENFQNIIGGFSKQYSAGFARRAMADLAFTDQNNLYYIKDVKTHRLETKFNMPNLTSVERLARFYEDDMNYYVVLMVAYNIISGIHIQVKKVHFVPIEFLSWGCLTIGALGWGQIQIANANNIIVNHGYSRKKWMLELCDMLFEFYPQEIEKVKDRIEYFKKVKMQWEQKKDIWKM
ncbi:MAG: hypothetical protein ACPL28_09060 [bacterium]